MNIQDDYNLQKPTRHPYKRARYVVSGIDNQWDADLADMSTLSKYNKGIKILLVVIDIFSRFLWVQPLKNKTAKAVVEGFIQIIQKVVNLKNREQTKVVNFQTDC